MDDHGYSYAASRIVEGDGLSFTGPPTGSDSDVVKVDHAIMAAFGETLGGDPGSMYEEQAFRAQMR